jgi:hypothetical protein
MSSAVFALQIGPERAPRGTERGVVQRRGAGDASNTVGSEEFFGHGRKSVFLKCNGEATDFLADDLGKV